MGAGMSDNSSIYPKRKFLYINNKRNYQITILKMSHKNDYKVINTLEPYEECKYKIDNNDIVFIYVYLGDKIEGDPITKIKNCHLFNNNTYIDIN